MDIQLLAASNPRYRNAAGTRILLDCEFSHFPGEIMPFIASQTDVEAHGRDIYARAVAGEFGPVAPYVKSQELINAEAAAAQAEADRQAAKTYGKLQALAGMTPAQVSGWVEANVTNLAQVQDALKTLAIAVSVLARRL